MPYSINISSAHFWIDLFGDEHIIARVENYAEKIKQLRKSSNVTLIELAQRIGLPVERILLIEEGSIRPTAEEIETIEAFITGRL
jgi:ribosome-binding protein aMBF1 (putative translation factor)